MGNVFVFWVQKCEKIWTLDMFIVNITEPYLLRMHQKFGWKTALFDHVFTWLCFFFFFSFLGLAGLEMACCLLLKQTVNYNLYCFHREIWSEPGTAEASSKEEGEERNMNPLDLLCKGLSKNVYAIISEYRILYWFKSSVLFTEHLKRDWPSWP